MNERRILFFSNPQRKKTERGNAMKSGRSLSTKIILMVEAILLLSGAVFCGISISRSQAGIRRAIRQRMVDIANCAAGSVNGNILKSLKSGDEGPRAVRNAVEAPEPETEQDVFEFEPEGTEP